MRLNWRTFRATLAAILLVGAANPGSAASSDFSAEIALILDRACGECHNPTDRASGFSVANLESVVRGVARHGQSVIAGHQ